MTHTEIEALLARVSLGDLWSHHRWNVTPNPIGDGTAMLSLSYLEPDVDAPADPVLQTTREWFIPRGATPSEVLRTVRKLCMGSLEHRLDEHLTVDGLRVYSPHREVVPG